MIVQRHRRSCVVDSYPGSVRVVRIESHVPSVLLTPIPVEMRPPLVRAKLVAVAVVGEEQSVAAAGIDSQLM